MGVSISINCRSKKAQGEMLAFLKEHFRSWEWVVTGEDKGRCVSDPQADLDYAHGKCQIGFNYGPSMSGRERYYYFTALRWMALQVGKERRKFLTDKPVTLPEPKPAMCYDGYDYWPVLIEKPSNEQLLWCWVDELGMLLNRDFLDREHGREYFYFEVCHFLGKFSLKTPFGDGVELRDDAGEILTRMRKESGRPMDVAMTKEEEKRLIHEVFLKNEPAYFAPIREEMTRLNNLWKSKTSV